MTALRNKFLRLAARDQLALVLLAIVLAIALSYLLLVRPMEAAKYQISQRVVTAEATLLDVRILVQQLRALGNQAQRPPDGDSTALLQTLEQSLNTAGFASASINSGAGGRSFSLTFDSVAMNQLLRWLASLQTSAALKVEDLEISPVDESGLVNALIVVVPMGYSG